MDYKTYKLKSTLDGGSVGGYVEWKEALFITVFLCLLTEKGRHEIYDSDYGIKRSDLYGERREYVMSMLGRRVREAIAKYYGDELSVSGCELTFDGDTLDFLLRLSSCVNAEEKTP